MQPRADNGMSFEEIILEVAEQYGIAEQAGSVAAIPTDAHNLDKVKRAVNRGYSRFLRHDPLWSFIRRPVRVTTTSDGSGPDNIERDASRYRLPGFCRGGACSNWRYIDLTSPYLDCVLIEERHLKRLLQSYPGGTGYPQKAAVGTYDAPDETGGQTTMYQVLFWPKPSGIFTLEADFMVRGHRLVELKERHVAGAQHDETIIALALELMYEADADSPEKQAAIKAAERELQRSVSLDEVDRVYIGRQAQDPSTTGTRTRGWARQETPTLYQGVPVT